jgi:hypothetical protein
MDFRAIKQPQIKISAAAPAEHKALDAAIPHHVK